MLTAKNNNFNTRAGCLQIIRRDLIAVPANSWVGCVRAEPRYATRKRTVVNYAVDGDDDAEYHSEDDGNWSQPQPMKPPTSKQARQPRQAKCGPVANAARKAKPCSFLNLSAEIRIMIYQECFDQEAGYYWISDKSRRGRKLACVNGPESRKERDARGSLLQGTEHQKARSINTALLRTNKFVHNDALSTLYGHPFKFMNPLVLQLFLIGLPQETISRLQHIELSESTAHKDHMAIALAMLAPAVDIRSLRVPSLRIGGERPQGCKSRKQFDRNLGGKTWAHDMTVDQWDRVIALNMARKTYRHMHTFLGNFLRSASKRRDFGQPDTMTPVAQLLSVLRVFEQGIYTGPKNDGRSGHTLDVTEVADGDRPVRFGRGFLPMPRSGIVDVPWSPKRRDAMRKWMAEDLVRLVTEQ